MNNQINDVEVAHDQALIYEEIQDARLRSLFAEVREMGIRGDEKLAQYRKEGRDSSDISEMSRDWDEAIFNCGRRTTIEVVERWFLPYGGGGV